MILQVNGKARECSASITLAGLLEALGLKASGLVVELNGQVVPRPEYTGRVLQEQDRLEIVQLVGGG